MEKKIDKNGITVIWDDNEIKDMFYVKNALYKLTLPNKQVYYGSAELLGDRIINHCTHVNLKTAQYRLFNSALKRYKKMKVSLIGEYETINEARDAEKKFIKGIGKRMYKRLGEIGNYTEVVNKVILNSQLYANYNCTYPRIFETSQNQ